MGEQTVPVLRGISLEIQAGELVAIMGPSGSGKSTLMNILGLLDIPTSGSFRLQETEISNMGEDQLAVLRRGTIGFIFQQFNLLPRLNAVENVALPTLYSRYRMDFTEAQTLLSRVGLESRFDHRPNQLSGGQQQRVAIARSLVNHPHIILADEPTGNLDSTSSSEVLGMLKELNDQGMTVIIVTHEPEVAAQAKRIIHIRDGLIASDETVAANKSRLASVPPALPSMTVRPSLPLVLLMEHFRQGINTLLSNMVRTALSMLGVMIGVAAVIAMLALGRGAREAIESQLASLGSNLLVLRPGPIRVPGGGSLQGSRLRITLEDAASIRDQVPGVRQSSPGIEGGNIQASYLNKNWSTRIIGVAPTYARMHALEPIMGRFITNEESQKRALVAVVGLTVVHELFGDTNPLGKMIKLNKVNFEIIGVLPEKGANGYRDQDDVVVVPVTAAMYRVLGETWVDYIEIEIAQIADMKAAQDRILALMEARHVVPVSQQQDAFNVRNMADIQAALSESSRTMSILLASIAAISLVVGGIGIMNIMLVSVTERTREIGLRKAVGATRADILVQFLVESAVVGIIGGLFGIVLGVGASLLLSVSAGWNTSITLGSIVISFLFSASIGVIFGLWPARRASMLNPIEALRYE